MRKADVARLGVALRARRSSPVRLVDGTAASATAEPGRGEPVARAGVHLRPASVVFFVSALAAAYWHVLWRLAHDWATDDNDSHGFLILPLAAYFVWERRERFARAALRPSWLGGAAVALGLAMLAVGTLGAELFTTRVSLIVVLAGTVLFVYGREHLAILAFPLAFLLLMVPLPAIVFNRVAFPLQLVASRFGELVLGMSHVPVLREGNVIVLSSTTLEVAEACSGIRSLLSLVTLGIVYGYFTDRRQWVRTAIALMTIPIAIVANGLRVAGTGLAAHRYGPEAAEGFLHTFSGWLVFVVALVLLFGLTALVQRVWPDSEPAVAARPRPAGRS